MEVILASIRRIIAEDGIQPPPGQRPPPLRPAPTLTSSAQPQPTASEAASAQTSPVQSAPVQPVIVQPAVIAADPVSTPAEPPVSSSPAAVWGILGDQPAGTGEELVLTQMVAADGSVVAFDKAVPSAPATRTTVKAAGTTAPAQPLDVLLLTDALPANMPDADLAVVPPPAPIPTASPPPPAAAAPSSAPPRSVPPMAAPIQRAPAIGGSTSVHAAAGTYPAARTRPATRIRPATRT